MISISNAIYLANIQTLGKRPIIGWQSIVTTSSLSTSSEDPDYPILNAWSPDTAEFWQAETVPTSGEIAINVNNPNNYPVDYLGLARHNFGTAAIAYTVQNSTDGASWDDVVASKTPADDRAIVEYFDASTRGFWRLFLEPAGATVPQLAHLKLGQALILQRPIYVGHKPGTLYTRTSRNTDLGDNGQYIGQVVTRRWRESDCDQQNNYPDWIRTYLTPFIDHTQYNRTDDDTPQGAFFYAWRPTDYPLEIVYGWTEDDIGPTNARPNGMMSYSFNMQAIA